MHIRIWTFFFLMSLLLFVPCFELFIMLYGNLQKVDDWTLVVELSFLLFDITDSILVYLPSLKSFHRQVYYKFFVLICYVPVSCSLLYGLFLWILVQCFLRHLWIIAFVVILLVYLLLRCAINALVVVSFMCVTSEVFVKFRRCSLALPVMKANSDA